jgi:predicted N-acetyltransferase YhbS
MQRGILMLETQPGLALLCVDEAAMTPALDVAIRELLCACFPNDAWNFSRTRTWHGSRPEYSIVYCEGARALGHVGVAVRELSCDGETVTVAGVQNVAVHPERRGTGLSRCLMHEAMEEAARRGLPYGLLFCVPGLERFYSFLGWERVEAAVTTADDVGDTEVPGDAGNIAMVKGLTDSPLRPKAVHLRGRDW